MLKTLASGQPAGTAKMSPSQANRGCCRTPELANWSGASWMPGRRRAAALAGSAAPFKAMVTALPNAPEGEQRQARDGPVCATGLVGIALRHTARDSRGSRSGQAVRAPWDLATVRQ